MVAGGLKDRAIAEKLDRSIERYVGEARDQSRYHPAGRPSSRARDHRLCRWEFYPYVDLLLPLRYEICVSGAAMSLRPHCIPGSD